MNYEAKANRLNELEREDIKFHLSRVTGHNSYKPNTTSLKVLFEYFNKYINSTPSDIWCGDCIKMVRNFWVKMVNVWT